MKKDITTYNPLRDSFSKQQKETKPTISIKIGTITKWVKDLMTIAVLYKLITILY